jgi:hypothetical protein
MIIPFQERTAEPFTEFKLQPLTEDEFLIIFVFFKKRF